MCFSEYKFHQYLSLDTIKLLVQYKVQHIAKGPRISKSFQGNVSFDHHKPVGKGNLRKFYRTTMPVRFARKPSLVKYFHHTVVKALFCSVMQGVYVVWQWFENNRWCSYSNENCQLIEKAYQEEESSVR